MQDWAKEHDIEWRFHRPYNWQAARLIERKNRISKQQIKILTGTTALALIHLNDQPVGPVAPYDRLGTPDETLNTVKVWKL